MPERAWVGRKPCGCPVFARVDGRGPWARWDRKTQRPVVQWPHGLDIRKVPIGDAHVVMCRCDD